jgi:hypothetical protein
LIDTDSPQPRAVMSVFKCQPAHLTLEISPL